MRRRLVDLINARPLTAAVAFTLLWHAVLFLAAETVPPMPGILPDFGATVVNLVAVAVPLAIAALTGWWREAGLGWRGPDRAWLLLLPVLLVNLTYALSGLDGDAEQLLGTALMCLAIGVSEEMLSRGVNQRALQPLGRFRAAVWVGVLFGLGHALSAVWFGRPWDDTLAQVISTTAFGFGYAALRWHLGTIWPLAFLHGLDDFLQIRSSGAAPLWWQATVTVLFVVYGWWLLRRLGPDPARATP